MHQTSDLYKEIVADRFHKVECKLLIDGVEYGENTLVSVETENNLFAEEAPSCGNAVSGTITAKLRTPNTVIRTKAKIELFARVTRGGLESEWIPKGVYFLDTREKQKSKNGEDTIIVLDGFDAILMGEQEYVPSGDWPKSDYEVLEEMCWILGVECVWQPDKNFRIQKPVGYSVREIIGYIAAMYGGSVTMDDSGRLKFVGLRQNQNGHEVVFSGLSVGDKLAPITKVILHKMDGNKFTAGDDSGRTLNVDSPWASQGVADYILEAVAGYEYQPFTATDVIVDPAVEIGDVLDFGGNGKCCFHHNTVYGKSLVSTMGAMEEKELDHDYKYKSSSSWGTGRALSGLKAEQEELADSFGVRIEEVNSALNVYVKNTDEYKEANTKLVSSISDNVSGLNLKVTSVETDVGELQTASAELTARVSGAEASIDLIATEDVLNGLREAKTTLYAEIPEKARAEIRLYAVEADGVTKTLAEILADQVSVMSKVNDTTSGLDTKVSNKDLTDKLKNYALASALGDYLTVNAAAELYVTSEGVTSIIGNYIVTDKDGTKKSLAQILADQILLQGRVDLTGVLSVENGVITSTGQIITQKNIRANTGLSSTKLELDTENFVMAGKSYTPTQITSTSGTVIVLETA